MKILATTVFGFMLFALPALAVNQINSIKGYLYYDSVDEWSKNITNPDFHIWNAVIGEGSLKHPAKNTLFVIEAQSDTPTNKISVIIKQKWNKKEETLIQGNRDCTYDKWAKKLFCSVVLPQVTVGTITVSAELTESSSNKVLSRKSISKEYGGGE